MYGFWGLVILVGILNRIWAFVSSRRQRVPLETQTGKLSLTRKISKALNIHLLQAPTKSHHHHQPWGWWTLPLRVHTIIIALYLVLHIVVVATRYHIYDEND